MNYCDAKENEDWQRADDLHEEFMIRGGLEMKNREVINLEKCELLMSDFDKLENYVWQGNLLIPTEMLEGE